jgi:hypothetical protein
MKPSASSILQFLVVTAAGVVAVFPPGPPLVERLYARQFYPAVQAFLTAESNLTRTSLFDVAVVAMLVMLVGGWVWGIRSARRARSLRPLGRGVAATATGAALVYLWFLGAWGLNYARPPLETALPFDRARVTPLAVRRLAEHAVQEANRTYDAAHAQGFPGIGDVPPDLVAALHDVERRLGRPRATTPARPKWSLLSPFFRASGVSGMLAPFFLETLINPDLTAPERPFILAHEWAHLSGFAPESDASFVGFLTALGADTASQYSAWLDLMAEASSQLQPVTRNLVLAKLAAGPRADQQAINARLRSLVKPVERAAWATYDQMLKSQGVEEGVQSYSRVIQLLLGTNALHLEP